MHITNTHVLRKSIHHTLFTNLRERANDNLTKRTGKQNRAKNIKQQSNCPQVERKDQKRKDAQRVMGKEEIKCENWVVVAIIINGPHEL